MSKLNGQNVTVKESGKRYSKNFNGQNEGGGYHVMNESYSDYDLFLLPEPKKYVPFTADDWELFVGKAVCMEQAKGLVTYCFGGGIYVSQRFFPYEAALKKLTFADGTPFGKEVTSEN